MKQVEIPFLKQFHNDIKNGQKIMTTRTRKYGEAGFKTITVSEELLHDLENLAEKSHRSVPKMIEHLVEQAKVKGA